MLNNLQTRHYIWALALIIFATLFFMITPSLQLIFGKTQTISAEITNIWYDKGTNYQYQFTINGQLIKSNDACRSSIVVCEKSSDQHSIAIEYLVSDPKINRIKSKTDFDSLKLHLAAMFLICFFSFLIIRYIRPRFDY